VTLPVPLTMRVGDKHITRDVSSLTFRKEAIGGLKWINLGLYRPLDRLDPNLAPLSRVYVYDGRSAATVAEGRLTDPGRSADSSDGQVWEMTAFGPAQEASDIERPYIVVDLSLEHWTRAETASTKNASTEPAEDAAGATPALDIRAVEGVAVSTSWKGEWGYRAILNCGQKLARISSTNEAGVTDANYRLQIVTRSGSVTIATNGQFNTTPSGNTAVVVSAFPDGDTVAGLRAIRQTSATNGLESHWGRFFNISVRAMLKAAAGTDITTGYTNNYVLAHEVVNDLLGRILTSYGPTAVVDTTGTYHIDQLAYPDGVTAAQVLTDLMQLEPAFRWYIDDNGTFHWAPWPTSVRYEATLAAGGSFPVSAQELYSRVAVRWRDAAGQIQSTIRTMACPILDNQGVTRQKVLDLGTEVGSAAAAIQAGDAFLADHNVPKNAGTLTIASRIRDLVTGRMVEPWEIQPGELIRVRGVESYPDALNASSNDALTVFRIWSTTHSSDSGSVQLELDTYSRSEWNALARLANARPRRG